MYQTGLNVTRTNGSSNGLPAVNSSLTALTSEIWNFPVVCVVCGIFALYLLGCLWIRRIEAKDRQLFGATVVPQRSFYRNPHNYFLLFYTGSGRHDGTTANVYCVLHGNHSKTKPVILRDPGRRLFKSGTMTSFLLTFNRSLDQITKVHIWHDISGPDPSWFLERIIVCHLNTGLMWHFGVHRWLDVTEDDGSVECTLEPTPRSNYLSRKGLFDRKFAESFRNNHIWLSAILRKSRATFPRLDRLTSCLAVVSMTLLIVTIAINSTENNSTFSSKTVKLGPFNLHVNDMIQAIICSVLPFGLRIVLEFFYTYASRGSRLGPGETDVEGYLEECLTRVGKIVFLDGQSNRDEQQDNQETRVLQEDTHEEEKEAEHGEVMDEEKCEISIPEDTRVEVDGERRDGFRFGGNRSDFSSPESVTSDITSQLAPNTTEKDVEQHNTGIFSKGKTRLEDLLKQPASLETAAKQDNQTGDDNDLNDRGEIKCTREYQGTTKENGEDDEERQIGDIQFDLKIENQLDLDERDGLGSRDVKSAGDCSISNFSGNLVEHNGQDVYNGNDCSVVPSDNNNSSEQFRKTENKNETANFVHSNSLTNNDKIPKLWQELPMPRNLVDKYSVRKRNQNCDLKLSGRYLRAAQALCIAIPVISSIVTLRYGFLWSSTRTISWLTALLFAFVVQILLVESVFIFLQSLYFAVFLQRPNEEDDLLNELNNKLWTNEGEDTNYFVDDLDEKDPSIPSPPCVEDIAKAREKAGCDRQLEEVLKMMAFNILFLLQLVIIGFGNRDVLSFPTRFMIENNFNLQKLLTINDANSFWSWAKTDLASGLYYDGLVGKPNGRLTRDGYSNLLGVPILRQQRIKNLGTCELPEPATPYFTQCNTAELDDNHLDKQHYYPGWKLQPESDVTKSNPSPWRYQTGSESNTEYSMWARLGRYTEGGYIATLGYNNTTAVSMLVELQAQGWIDQYTRVVLVEFAVYNGNINILAVVQMTVEFTAFGGAFPRYEIFSFRLYRYFTTFQLGYLVCEVLFVVFIALLMYRVGGKIAEQGWSYFQSFWNLTDVALIISALVTIGLYGARAIQLQHGIEAIGKNPSDFYGFYQIALYDELVAYMSCLLIIIPTIQFLKFLKFNKNFMIFYSTLYRILPDIGGFAVIFLVSLICFTFWAYEMLRLTFETYNTFFGAFNNIVSMLMGKFSYRLFAPGNINSQDFGPLFTYVFTVANVFYIMNIILAIITIGFQEARMDDRFQQSQYEIIKFIVEYIKDALCLIPPYIPPIPKVKTKPVDYAYLQLKLNTRYVLHSQMDRIMKFANEAYIDNAVYDIELMERVLRFTMDESHLNALVQNRRENK